jgi:diguanylate cyclase (GGDEF)-like protein
MAGRVPEESGYGCGGDVVVRELTANWARGALALLPVWLCLLFPWDMARAEALPVLTTARAVHTLTMDEARRGYPVRLHGIVAYYDAFLDYPQPILMVMDETGSVFVKLPLQSDLILRAGDRVLVTGESIVGGFAPDVGRPQVQVLGASRLPETAPLRSLTDLLRGAEDAPWVEMEGVVHAVQDSAHEVILKIAGVDGDFTAVTPNDSSTDYRFLAGARVRLRGLACTLFNNRRQIVGVQLRFAGLDMVTVEEPAPPDPYALPVSRVRTLLSFTPGRERDRLAHLHGAVTLFWPGRLLCLQDGRDGLCSQTAQTTPVLPGQLVDAVGFPRIGSYSPTLTDAAFQAAGGAVTLVPPAVDPERVLRREYDAQLVQIDGELIGENNAAGDPTILLAAGKLIFSASLPKSADTDRLLHLEEGSRLRVVGICSIVPDPNGVTDADGYAVARSFRLLLRSPVDVTVLERPSWWSAAHTLRVLAAALVAISGVLAWVLVLRRRLQKQTALLQFQATHDSLTGLWNRKAILEMLGREWALTARAQSSLAIMMLDADHFKQVNDTYGHLAGDAVLRTISERIRKSVRGSELIGRYGGEEFLIVLPGSDEVQVGEIAERVRQAIAEEPVRIDQGFLAVTVSIGTAIIEPLSDTEKDALATADNALYESKNLGRNRVTVALTGGRARARDLQAGLSR